MRDELSELTRRATHDLNNHMAAILTFADLVLEELPPHHPSRTEVQEIRAASINAIAGTRQLAELANKVAATPIALRAA